MATTNSNENVIEMKSNFMMVDSPANSAKTTQNNTVNTPASCSSYKYLSWREKDRRRRFREEWRHTWLVVPYGSYEVQCLVCHKVMTQRKLDTIKRHTLRRHSEILQMQTEERVLLFDRLLLQHNKLNGNKSNSISESEHNSETIGELDSQSSNNAFASSISSKSSSNSLSPSNCPENTNGKSQNNKRFTQNQKLKNPKMAVNSNSMITSSITPNHFKQNFQLSHSSTQLSSLSTSSSSITSNNNNTTNCNSNLLDGNINGTNLLSPIFTNNSPIKCPWCHFGELPNDIDSTINFSNLLNHIQIHHNDQLDSYLPSSINYFSQNNSHNTSLMSFLYYQELLLRYKHSDSALFKHPNLPMLPPSFPLNNLNSPQPQKLFAPIPSNIFSPGKSNTNMQSLTKNHITTPPTTHATNTSKSRINFLAESLFTDSAFHSPKTIKSDFSELKINVDDSSPMQNNISIKSEETMCDFGDISNQNLEPISSASGQLKCHTLRFGPNQNLIECLKHFVSHKNISCGFIMSCCGSVKSAKLRMADSGIVNTNLEIKEIDKHYEIVSMEGSIYSGGSHIHCSLSDSSGDVIGGHVLDRLIIHTTAEVLLGEVQGVNMFRKFDKHTNYDELHFTTSPLLS